MINARVASKERHSLIEEQRRDVTRFIVKRGSDRGERSTQAVEKGAR